MQSILQQVLKKILESFSETEISGFYNDPKTAMIMKIILSTVTRSCRQHNYSLTASIVDYLPCQNTPLT